MNNCKVPPEGWYCTRESGHSGPCAAYPVGFDETNIEDYFLSSHGTFNTSDCISYEDLRHLFKVKEVKDETAGD